MGLFDFATKIIRAPVKVAAKIAKPALKIAKPIAKPVTRSVQAVGQLAQGDLGGALSKAGQAFVATNPLTMANSASGGKLAELADKAPVVGGTVSRLASSGSAVADGDQSQLGTYIKESAKVAGAIYGGTVLASALTPATALAAGSALAKGNSGGAILSLAGELVPGSEGYLEAASNFLPSGGRSPASVAPGNQIMPASGVVPKSSSSLSTLEIAAIGAAVIGVGAVLITKGRR